MIHTPIIWAKNEEVDRMCLNVYMNKEKSTLEALQMNWRKCDWTSKVTLVMHEHILQVLEYCIWALYNTYKNP